MIPRFFVSIPPTSPVADRGVALGRTGAPEGSPPGGDPPRDGVAHAEETPAHPAAFSHPSVAPGSLVPLGEGDARHARTVLRSRVGEECEVVFPDVGLRADCVFADVGKRVVVVRVTAVYPEPPRRVRLLLAQALPQPRKLDEVVEKGTEVGYDSFLVFPAAASPAVPFERIEARAARWRTIAGEAAKQSRQPAVPGVSVAPTLAAAVEVTAAGGYRSVVLVPGEPSHLGDVLTPEAGAYALWVGPEGGWSEEEKAALLAAGATAAGLGPRVLRTETAGPVAGGVARYVLSDW